MGTLTCAARYVSVGGRILGYTLLFTVILLTDAVSVSKNINLSEAEEVGKVEVFHSEQVIQGENKSDSRAKSSL